ncbi:Sterol desaturase/sphingolipid hydroxylase, fatty acid hydroxylase superfamily [Sphingomonas guangdongensis]|uniref:Sterol desaturase/sphingolipid hydroxylase, fatty acid hydroxylase superfamily n=1 Tax=Sphingomonas guangdongensis TaxID=1141890 RepID=A0A285QZZ7_9SPHN|nr:sterol desaturase family protein [Sphingomonas guangdongensis]SOB86979.1 Sterol desaturase/sphingolipid hydroxylase, fatty acid hydroxylase superfamily [Sphingomonas guangdongensis]
MEQFLSLLDAAAPTLTAWAFSFSFMTALELLLPRSSEPVLGRLPGLMFWGVWLLASAGAYAAFRALWSAWGIPPLLVLPTGAAWAGPLAVVIAPLLSAVVYDFFFYWCHRAQHRWLWKYHAVHHSIRELSAVNAFHHVTEPLQQIVLIAIPASLISSEAGPAMPIMLLLLQLQASFIHSPSRLHLGPLARLVVDNRFHRIHHSVEERHFDHNFGAFTTVWDRLFGTAWMPAKDDWPDTGIAEVDQPRTLRDWVMLPADYEAARRGERYAPKPLVGSPAAL